MNTPIPQKDLEALSAYIDNQLTEKERASLETRLESDEALRVSLSEIQSTRQILRQTPRLRAPRNFMLTPEMAGVKMKKPKLGLFNSFRFAFVMTSVLFALIVAGDLGNLLPRNLPVAQAPIAESFADTAADVAEESVAEDTILEAESLAAVAPDEDAVGESEAAGSGEAAPDAIAAEQPAEEADAVASDESGDSVSDDAFSLSTNETDDSSESTTTQIRSTATPSTDEETSESEDDASIADENAIESTEQIQTTETETPEIQQSTVQEDRTAVPKEDSSLDAETTVTTISTTRVITWLIEAFLVGLMVFLGIGTLILWRRNRA